MGKNSNIINNIDNIQDGLEVQQETNQTIEVNKFELTEIINYKECLELLGMIFLIVGVIGIYLSYKKIINRKSKNNYENNLRNKKYIEDIYI